MILPLASYLAAQRILLHETLDYESKTLVENPDKKGMTLFQSGLIYVGNARPFITTYTSLHGLKFAINAASDVEI